MRFVDLGGWYLSTATSNKYSAKFARFRFAGIMIIKPILKHFKHSCPEEGWRTAGHPFEIIVEIGGIFEAEGIGDVGDVPVGMLQKGFGFADDPFRNMGGRRFARHFPHGAG